jgi:hypothetical protein
VHVTLFGASTPSTDGTYSIMAGPPPPLTITFPVPCCNAGTVGSAYFQNLFSSGGVGPFTPTITAGDLPPGVKQASPNAPQVTGNNLSSTPTKGRRVHLHPSRSRRARRPVTAEPALAAGAGRPGWDHAQAPSMKMREPASGEAGSRYGRRVRLWRRFNPLVSC